MHHWQNMIETSAIINVLLLYFKQLKGEFLYCCTSWEVIHWNLVSNRFQVSTLGQGNVSPSTTRLIPKSSALLYIFCPLQGNRPTSWLSCLSIGLLCRRSGVHTRVGPTLRVFKQLSRECSLFNNICKWLDSLVFLDKDDEL